MKMNVLLLITLTIFYFFCSSCVQTKAIGSNQSNSKTNRVILEIDNLNFGSMDSFNGRNLGFRLYDDGSFEYEEISDEKLKELKSRAFSSEIISKKEGTLSETKLIEIKEILSSKEFNKIKDYFKNAEGFCTCGASRTEIRYKIEDGFIKNINIDGSGCADLTNPDKKVFPNYPEILSQLLKEIQEIKYPKAENS